MSEIDTTIALQGKEIVRLRAINAELVEALKKAEPVLNENYRFHRDVQSDAAQIARAFKVAATVRAAIAKAEKEGA